MDAAAAAVVGGDRGRAGVVAALHQAGEACQRHPLGAEDLGVRAAGQQSLGESDAAAGVGQSLLQLHLLQVELVPAERGALLQRAASSWGSL